MLWRIFTGLTAASAILLATAASAATIIVNSSGDAVADDGACTLREAINSANSNAASGGSVGECIAGEPLPTVDTIAFGIPGSGVQTIEPTTSLPDIMEPVTIDGYSQPGASPNTLALGNDATLLIDIDGTTLGSNQVLTVRSGGITIRGLILNHLDNVALEFIGDGNTVLGNFFQTDASGNVFAGGIGAQSMLYIIGNSNRIGSADPADRNVIGGGGSTAADTIEMAGDSNVVQGNYIGLTADGTAALSLIVGTNALAVDGQSTNTLIGGTAPGEGNAILGTNLGIQVALGAAGDNTVIQGNTIGTDATGSYAVAPGSAVYGIIILGAKDTTIGGAEPGAGNVISGNATGIIAYQGDEPGTIIQGNMIGTDRSGRNPVSNYGPGIYIASPGVESSTPVASTIGGTNPGEGNTIAYNCGAGVFFGNQPTYTQWPILGNSIFSNRDLGISLDSASSPLPNDDGDADTGANNLQNYPILTSASITGGTATISGTLNSAPGTTFRVEFFADTSCDASGFGEGQLFIGSADVGTDSGGNASFGPLSFPVDGSQTELIATATDPDGNTSEFSECVGPHNLIFASGFETSCSGGG